jgi:hypothetical protein
MIRAHSSARSYTRWTQQLDPNGTTINNYSSADKLTLGSGLQFPVNLEGWDEIRASVLRGATALTGAKMSLRGYTTTSLTVSNFVAIGESSADVEVDVATANTVTDSGWVTIDKSLIPASGDLVLAWVEHGGDGTTDPQFIHLGVELREAADKVHIQPNLGTASQSFKIWMQRDYETVLNPTNGSVAIFTTSGSTYKGSRAETVPNEDGSFTLNLDATLSASTSHDIKVSMTDATGTLEQTFTIST